MKLSQQVARMFCVGFDGLVVPPEIDRLLDRGVGSVALFRRNVDTPSQFADLCGELKRRAGRPLAIGIDQEGGRVMRLRGAFTDVPAMRELGRTGDENLAYSVGQILGKECRAMNVDIVFAPVLDVDTNPDNPVIADRSLSADPAVVSKLGVALLRGIQSVGVASCGKHFPGHGDTYQDSHHTLPSLEHDLSRIEQTELPPFQAAINADVAAIMSAHVVFKRVDSSVPATLSSKILQGILRKRLGFDGVIISDDMEMKAIASNYGIHDAVIRGAKAGCDLIMICHSHEAQNQAIDALTAAVESGKVPLQRIVDANRRLDTMCNRFVKGPHVADLETIGCASHRAVADRIRAFAAPITIGADPTEAMTRA